MVLLLFSFLFTAHWIGDFVLQSHEMSINKSKSWKWLSIHVAIYTATITLVATVMFGVDGLIYGVVNGALHFATDAVTSRITSSLWKKERVHDFFVMIGLDQLIHAWCLIWTLSLVSFIPIANL